MVVIVFERYNAPEEQRVYSNQEIAISSGGASLDEITTDNAD